MRDTDVSSHLREIAFVFRKPKSDEEERKGADDFPLPVNLLLSTYSFFVRNFLFAFRLSERGGGQEKGGKGAARENAARAATKCECTSSDCSRKSG